MLYGIVKALHVLAVVLWLGGMVFAHCFLRPALAGQDAPQRLTLMRDVLRRFLGAVLPAVLLILLSGAWMLFSTARAVSASGGSMIVPPAWHLMAGLGIIMSVIYAYVRYVAYPKLNGAVQARDWPAAGRALTGIRHGVATTIVLGLVIVAAVYAWH
ncbi:MAG: CopD family protein [Bordetella sp.]|nr:CopD family protein [Bordetella sp.]